MAETVGRVSGKVALITGAARGQGRAQAIRLAEEGADIIAVDICAQIDTVPYPMGTRADLEQTIKDVEALDRRICAVEADVRDPAALQRAVDNGIAALGPIDIVIANAGIVSYRRAVDMTPDAWQATIDVNLTGAFNTVHAALPAMIERGAGGSIILTSSTAGIKGLQTVSHYAAAKHGLVGMMKSLANELGRYRIRVNTIHPSAVATPMLHNDSMYQLFRPDLEKPTQQDLADVMKTMHLIPDPWAQPRDISDAVLFLASDESKYITGQQLKIDLGFCER